MEFLKSLFRGSPHIGGLIRVVGQSFQNWFGLL
jgi:hypothetical protein